MINRNNKKLIDEYLEYREKVMQLVPMSVKKNRVEARHYLTWCDETDFRLAPKLPVTFVEYVNNLRKEDGSELSQSYKRSIIISAKYFFEWLAKHKKGYHRLITPAWLDTFRFKTYPEEFDESSTILEDEMRRIARLPVENLIERRTRAGACFLYISGMRISAFTTMPIKAVNIEELELRQSPSLGMKIKNNKSATTHLLDLEEFLRIVRKWDSFVRAELPIDAYWFAKISPQTLDIDPSPDQAGLHRASIFRRDLKNWLEKHGLEAPSPHDFRRGHANFLVSQAKDMPDLEAAKANLMHSSILTTELYARQRKSQTKSRIRNMSRKERSENTDETVMKRLDEMEQRLSRLDSMEQKLDLLIRSVL